MPITLVLLVMTFVLQPNIVGLSEQLRRKQYDSFDATVTKIGVVTAWIGLGLVVATYLVGVWALRIIFGFDFTPYRLDLTVIIAAGVVNALAAIGVTI